MKAQIIYPVLALLLLAASCKKNTSPDDDMKNRDNLLTDPTTGWKRVAIVPFDDISTGRGTSPYNSMKGFDLQKINGQFAVLYTQHGLDVNNRLTTDWFFKAMVSENKTAQPEKINFVAASSNGSGNPGPYGNYTFYAQFVPGTSTPVFTGIDYTNHYIVLLDKTGNTIGGAPSLSYPKFRYTADGEFIAGGLAVGDVSSLWHYKNPPNPVGDFMYTMRPATIDANKRLFNIPFKAADGNYYEFSLCSKNGSNTFMAIRCREDRIYGSNPPNYEIVDSGPVADMPQGGFSADNVELLTYDYNSTNGEITFVFDSYNNSNSGNIYCYRWKQGSLTKLWQTSLDNDVDFRKAIMVYTNQNKLNDWRLKPNGTLYLMGNIQSDAPKNTDPTIKLWEVNNSGIKVISTLTYEQTIQKSFEINTCRYIDGTYYALAYPTYEEYQIGDPHFHLEVVKLTP